MGAAESQKTQAWPGCQDLVLKGQAGRRSSGPGGSSHSPAQARVPRSGVEGRCRPETLGRIKTALDMAP